jgi:hypothetical protein
MRISGVKRKMKIGRIGALNIGRYFAYWKLV